MRRPSERELLDLWGSGLARHPIDRALLLCAWARPDVAAERLALLPLGSVNDGLLRLRCAMFGPRVEACIACDHCGEMMEVALDIADMLGDAGRATAPPDHAIEGFRFRPPDSRDLAAIAGETDVDAAADRLLERCCIARPAEGAAPASVRESAEDWMEAADPLSDLRLHVTCDACGHAWSAELDPGVLLWDEVQRGAREVLGQVHRLAGAYGWTEAEILALSPQRRSAYLAMVNA